MTGRLDFPKTFSSDLVIDDAQLHMLAESTLAEPDPDTAHILNTPHTHPFCELFACGDGLMTFRFGDTVITLHSGDAVLVPAMIPHCVGSCEEAVWASVSFLFTHRSGSGTHGLYALLHTVCAAETVHHLHTAPMLYDDMRVLSTLIADDQVQAASVRFAQIIVLSAELCRQTALAASGGTAVQSGDPAARLRALDTILNQHFMHRLTAKEIASQLFVSERQLSRIIRKKYGTTLTKLLTERRLSAATSLLNSSNRPLPDIAAAAGFGSVASFYREFAKKYGISPARYRKQSKHA